jgi:adiponectin receptor
MFAYEAYTATSALTALPTTLFSIFALLCLLTSVAWHICAGCSSPRVMETAARIDYLGIGWLISASIATVVYYSFSCRKMAFSIYLSMNILAGLAGSILPFMQWFNERKHKKWRIVFFLSLALTGFIPIVHMCMIHSGHETYHYILPIVPSLASYVAGLLFYAFHFPECLWPAHDHDKLIRNEKGNRSPPPARWTDWVGGGSHAIWHVFIIVAVLLHRNAIPTLTKGLGGECCDVWGRN